MKDVSAKILALFDELGCDSLDLHTFFEMAGSKEPKEREDVLDAVAELVGVGLLQSAEGGDFYARTEDGRIAVAGPRDVTLYTREDCHLCVSAKSAMAPILKECNATLREVDVDRDPILQRRYTNDVPVIFIGPNEFARHRVDPAEFRRKLQQTRR
ncbi:MAG: glutaredoxin family protein [Candidatus Acidiferrales bacterium]